MLRKNTDIYINKDLKNLKIIRKPAKIWIFCLESPRNSARRVGLSGWIPASRKLNGLKR